MHIFVVIIVHYYQFCLNYLLVNNLEIIAFIFCPHIGTLISFESLEYIVPENGGPVKVCLVKSAPTALGFTVQLEARQTQPMDATGKN